MNYYVEKDDPIRDLGGLCECFVQTAAAAQIVARAHIHRHFELLYCLKGTFELMIERQTFLLRAGDAALIHPLEPHPTRTPGEEGGEYLVLKFTPDALYAANQPIYEVKYIFPYLHFSFQRSYVYTRDQLAGSGMEEMLLRILKERREAAYGYEMAVRAYITQVLLWFIRAWHGQDGTSAMEEKELEKLRLALEYIEAHLEDELRLQTVARHLCMGVSTFSRFFSRAAGSSFPAYVRSLRLSRAMALLIGSEKTITEIAMETGFSSASYLILSFRRQYRLTPAQFRSLYARGEKE